MKKLIELDTALDAFKKELTEGKKRKYVTSCSAIGYEGAKHILESLPTVDAVTVKHGRWIIKDNPGAGWYQVTCSECGEDVTSTIPMIGFFPNCKAIWDFCPYCGTNMDLKDGEHHDSN